MQVQIHSARIGIFHNKLSVIITEQLINLPKQEYLMLHIYNTLSRKKEQFKPLQQGKVGLYVCGITVYDVCHMGHARTYLSFDLMVRYLRHLGYKVNYVRNITDVDDNIIKRAKQNGETTEELTERTIALMHEDFAAINLLKPDIEPRVTTHIHEIIDIIQRLIEKRPCLSC